MQVTSYKIGKAGLNNPAFQTYAKQFKEKFKSGEYKTEAVDCFCGSKEYIPITEMDRYGFDYQLVLCRNCGLLYANPRMTENTFREFYENEYRHIYDTKVETPEYCFENQRKWGDVLSKQLDQFELYPKVIFDFGCSSGGYLSVFKDKGCDILGVDLDPASISYGRQKGLNLQLGGLEVLEESGKKANLIILSQTLEHFLDLESDLLRLRDLLAPDGIIYITTPGLIISSQVTPIQNAHTYQFTATSLTYVMECCGFMELFINDEITSLWTKSQVSRPKDAVDTDEVRYAFNYFFGKERLAPKVRAICKFSVTERKENVKYALASGIPDIDKLEMTHKGSEAVIIGGGPSVDGYIKTIRDKIDEGAIVISIERMYSWCLDHSIVPNYVVVLDASNDVMQSFNSVHSDVKHIIAAQVKHEVIDYLKGHDSYVFNVHQPGIPLAQYFADGTQEVMTLINSGSSVTLCAMSVAMYLGCKDFSVFGFDCHVSGGNYAKGITGVGDIKDQIEVTVNGRRFKTTGAYLSFGQQFFQLVQMARTQELLGKVLIYGDSLVSQMSRENIRG